MLAKIELKWGNADNYIDLELTASVRLFRTLINCYRYP